MDEYTFVTPPACVAERWRKYNWGSDESLLRAWYGFGGSESMINRWVSIGGMWDEPQMRTGLASVGVPDAKLVKEGNLAAVFLVPGGNVIYNVARDKTDATDQLMDVHQRHVDAYAKNQKDIVRPVGLLVGKVGDSDSGLAIQVVERIEDECEVCVLGGRPVRITQFNGIEPPDYEVLLSSETDRLCMMLERVARTGIDIDLRCGDVVQAGDDFKVVSCRPAGWRPSYDLSLND